MTEKMTNTQFGTWRCGNRSCPNHQITGMEMGRMTRMKGDMPRYEPATNKCRMCGVVTGVV